VNVSENLFEGNSTRELTITSKETLKRQYQKNKTKKKNRRIVLHCLDCERLLAIHDITPLYWIKMTTKQKSRASTQLTSPACQIM